MSGRERPRDRLVGVATKAFVEHWNSLLTRLEAGEDVPAARRTAFLAGSKEDELREAKRFYSKARVRELAALDAASARRMISPWLDPAVKYALAEKDFLEPSFLSSLVRAEYVVLVASHVVHRGQPSVTVHPFPDESVRYGDLYEISASGFSVGAKVSVIRSTAEPFTDAEREALEKGIRRNFYANADEDGDDEEAWDLQFLDSDDPRWVVFDVTEGETEEEEDEEEEDEDEEDEGEVNE